MSARDTAVLFLGRDHHVADEVGGAAREVRGDGVGVRSTAMEPLNIANGY
jgi:hypothetical protein